MPETNIYKPDTIIFGYIQNKNDKDYGSCLWADFTFDMSNHRLNINSDCGDYTYQSHDNNDFLELMRHINADYLIEKIAEENWVDQKQTFENLKSILADSEPDDYDLEQLKTACEHTTYNDVYFHLQNFIENYSHEFEEISYLDLGEYIAMDYNPKAKTIVSIFTDYIQPEIRKYLK